MTELHKAKPVRVLRVHLRTLAGLDLEKEWGPREVLPEGLRGQIVPPMWLLHPQRRELPDSVTVLEGQIKVGAESKAAHWMGLE